MAHHRLGHPAEARRDLADAARTLKSDFPEPGETDFTGWQEAVTLLAHCREAAALVNGPASATATVPSRTTR
jgi:hypothetical protein